MDIDINNCYKLCTEVNVQQFAHMFHTFGDVLQKNINILHIDKKQLSLDP
jgi:hypothetical protein